MLLSSLIHLTSSKLSCQDPFGKDVDWFHVFKVPSMKDKIPNHVSGLGFFYQDPKIKLTEATSDVGSFSNNPLFNSMKPLYSGKDDKIGYLLISDQPPNCDGWNPSDSYAHKKGVLIFDKDNGIYIEHSVPRYPNDPKKINKYQFPSTGSVYGQTALCVSLSKDDIETWAQGMLIEKGYVYANNTPSWTFDFAPSIKRMEEKKWDKVNKTMTSILKIGKSEFRLFSKAGKRWGKDLYHDLVAPTLKTDTYTETWSRGVGTIGSNCTGAYSSYNVLDVNFNDVKWTRMNDHSKWAIAKDYFCVGGINRQAKQLERGGGTWCLHDKDIANRMRNTVVTDFEKC